MEISHLLTYYLVGSILYSLNVRQPPTRTRRDSMTRTNRPIDALIDYRCPTCGKVFVHVKPDAPVTHHEAQDHRLEGQRLEAIMINDRPIWGGERRMNPKTVIDHLITDTRSLLHSTNGDVPLAVKVALQDAQAALPQADVIAAIEAFGGSEAVIAAVTTAVTRPLTTPELYEVLGWPPDDLPSRADIEAQIAFEQAHGASSAGMTSE